MHRVTCLLGMARCCTSFLLWVCYSCSLCAGSGDLLKDGMVGVRSPSTGVSDPSWQEDAVLPIGDTVSEHMLRLYDKYSGGGRRGKEAPSKHHLPLQDGNTVRSFRALNGELKNTGRHIFNLTSLTSSENILSATLHYYLGDLFNTSHRCRHLPFCARNGHRKHDISLELAVSSFKTLENQSRVLGNFFINISTSFRDFPSWQWKDITQALHNAKQHGETLIGINMTTDMPNHRRRQIFGLKPYILVYANDSAISEPDSVVSNLQGKRNPLTHKPHRKTETVELRRKRSTDILLPLQNNELPGAEYQYNEDEEVWEEKKPFKNLHVRPAEKGKNKKKLRKGARQKGQTLQFDEQTLKKARKKQWNEPRNCARRYLKVDFADIGWSEWIISPKSFDAYYCSGACQFPMPKSLKPSNHATIQSIVRAVGVVPGIPEPCCVPEKMSSLSILFFDENKNVVLKVYPNMTVESCACR